MSADPHAPQGTQPRGEHAEYHPSTREYLRVGIILFVLTCIEVALSYSSIDGWKLIALLLACTVLKFLMVVAYFMHLKFDNARFSRLFALGAIGAFTLYVVVLLTFNVWSRVS